MAGQREATGLKIHMAYFVPLAMLLLAAEAPGSQPLPDSAQLRQKALVNMRASSKALERYACSVRMQLQQVDGDGRVKKTEKKEVERFFVNGMQIDHVLAKDGRQLKGGEAEKEQKRVDKQVKKFSDPKQVQKVEERREKQFEMFLRAQRLRNGHREQRNGRSTLTYDLVPDEKFRPKNLEERFAKAVDGRISLDEESGAPVELKIETTRDVKIAGGLLANLHKGFNLHLTLARQPGGVWLTKLVEGNGDVRAGIFFHPRFRFREQTSSCRLFSVDSTDVHHSSDSASFDSPSR